MNAGSVKLVDEVDEVGKHFKKTGVCFLLFIW
jgi:hypothetical protein